MVNIMTNSTTNTMSKLDSFFAAMRSAITETNGKMTNEQVLAASYYAMEYPNAKIDKLYAETKKDNQYVVSAIKDNKRYAFVCKNNQIIRCMECEKVNFKWTATKKVWGWKGNSKSIIVTQPVLQQEESCYEVIDNLISEAGLDFIPEYDAVVDYNSHITTELDKFDPNNYRTASEYYRATGNLHRDGNELSEFNQELEDFLCPNTGSAAWERMMNDKDLEK
jgi:predicted RNA-binding Zn-ribbon protein involved in translation (DUF1610 family)